MEEVRGVIHGRPAGSAPLTLAGGRAAVDNSSRLARTPFGLPFCAGLFGNVIKARSPGLHERIKRGATRYDCDRISDLFVEFCDSWP